jgi:hypothetical protein
MGRPVVLIGCLVFVAMGAYNAWRAWHWTEIPKGVRPRAHLIPLQVPGIVFFSSYPVISVLYAVLGGPANGSPRAVATGVVGATIGFAGGLLGVSTYWFGRPQRLIAPVARDVPRWSPGRRRAEPGTS